MRNKGNLMLEYVVLITVVIAGLLVMQTYIRRAVCGRWRQNADVFGSGRQYQPDVTKIN